MKSPKQDSNTTIPPIYLRITVGGKRCEISIGHKCESKKWCKKSQRALGNREEIRKLNIYLDQFQAKVYQTEDLLIRNSEEVTSDALRNLILGKKETVKTIIKVFKDHNSKIEELVGKEFAAGTSDRYKTSLKHTQDFMEWKYNLKNMNVKKCRIVNLF